MPLDYANKTVRADLARDEFSATGEGVVWAVVGTGIDGAHPHFARHDTLRLPAPLRHVDFTEPEARSGRRRRKANPDMSEREALIDMTGLGTYCAALIAGETVAERMEDALIGIAPRCKLLSLKAYSEESAAMSERAVLLALDHILKLNAEAHRVHGVLIIFGFPSAVRNYPCGGSPVCQAVETLVRSGVVVVAAAGNGGYNSEANVGVPYSIRDPGNAELAITVGATHRSLPQQYGPSFFSSRGPTLDGRAKPDLLAPGERVVSAWPIATVAAAGVSAPTEELDGTMTSAAIVAGGAALILSAFPGLHRRPLDLKKCLMSGAADLGRDRYGQGAGLLDVLTAMHGAKAIAAMPGEEPPPGAEAPAIAVPAARASGLVDDELRSTPSLASERSKWPFAVALSFSGEDREFVQRVAWRLRSLGIAKDQIFYDDFYPGILARPNLDAYLTDVYARKTELIVPFLSTAYAKGNWTGIEWTAVSQAMRRERSGQVMPIRIDDVLMPGMWAGDSWLDARERVPEEVAFLIRERLQFERDDASGSPTG